MSEITRVIPKPAITYGRVLGAVVEHYRTQKSMTQQVMAAALGISQSAYSRLELGQSVMSVTQLRAIAAQLGMHVAVLLQHAEEYSAQLQQQGVRITDQKPESAAGVLIALGILAALVAASKS